MSKEKAIANSVIPINRPHEWWINQIVCGDCLEIMKDWPDMCVQMCVTSPPYWGLRSYGHWFMQTIWGTTWALMEDFCRPKKHKDRWLFRLRWRAAEKGGVFSRSKKNWIGAYGLEPSLEMYVHHTVTIFREVKRVLRDDGTLWLNLGDSYMGCYPGARDPERWPKQSTNDHRPEFTKQGTLSAKNLCGMPWRVALALQADGWVLRQEIIWNKPNPMPESCKDRCTKAHEQIFLLSKKPQYYYDAEAIKEPSRGAHARKSQKVPTGWDVSTGDGGHGNYHKDGRRMPGVNPKAVEPGKGIKQNTSFAAACSDLVDNKNKRSVWTVTSQPYKEAHFATFPEKLIEPCILAGTSAKGCCPECGGPWEPMVEDSPRYAEFKKKEAARKDGSMRSHSLETLGLTADSGNRSITKESITTGWRPTCDCGAENNYVCEKTKPCIVFDPFMGSGTVAKVAMKHGRSYVGTELSPEYCAIARSRLEAVLSGVPVKEAQNGQGALFR